MPTFHPVHDLGRTGMRVTPIGIGDLADRAAGPERCVAGLRRAMDAGLNVIDTAPNYEDGFSEEVVGAALRGRRDGMFLIDKIDDLEADVAPQVEGSLARLGLDHVDLFVFHSVSEPAEWEPIARPGGGMDQLARCIERGQAAFRGISSHHPDVLRAALDDGRVEVVMFPLGPFADRRYEDEILPLARERGVGVISFKTFGAGMLLGDTSGYGRPLEGPGPAGSGPGRPRLTVEECVHYTLSVAPDVALLGLSTPEEQDAAFTAAASFRGMDEEARAALRERAALAIAGKGRCWWNPAG